MSNTTSVFDSSPAVVYSVAPDIADWESPRREGRPSRTLEEGGRGGRESSAGREATEQGGVWRDGREATSPLFRRSRSGGSSRRPRREIHELLGIVPPLAYYCRSANQPVSEAKYY